MSAKGIVLFFILDALHRLTACSKDPIIPFDLNKKELKTNLYESAYTFENDAFRAYFKSSHLLFINSVQNTNTHNGSTFGRVLVYLFLNPSND